MMVLHWPQVCMLIWIAAEIGFKVAMHGTPRSEEHNWFVSAIVSAAFVVLLYFGGFWTGGKP